MSLPPPTRPVPLPIPPPTISGSPGGDPFGTAALREVVLAAWRASPARFREDANAEESLAVGGYAGRVLVELTANGVDAAVAAGVPGRIRIRIQDDELRVANTGAPLTADGVAALASLRASAKRDGSGVGRFGVGFTAVLDVSDAPRVVSTTGSVAFDRARTAELVSGTGGVGSGHTGLAAEVDRRGGQVPALRLPWPGPDGERPPPGYATEIRLPLRDTPADVAGWLAPTDDLAGLFWALPGLAEIDTAGGTIRRRDEPDGIVVLTRDGLDERFLVVDVAVPLPAALLAHRPVEERVRPDAFVRWVLELDPATPDQDGTSVVPRTARSAAGRTVGAPTPTDEPISFPALLIGRFPVDDTRRRLADDPITDLLLDAAVVAYLDLLATVDADRRLDLVPAVGFPLGTVDGRLRDGVLAGLRTSPVLTSVTGEGVTADRAVVLPGLRAEGAVLVGEAVPGLLPPVSGTAAMAALRALGVRTLTPAEVTGALAGLDREPSFWRSVYDALAEQDPAELADIPVPLVSGRRAVGARGALLPADGDASTARAGRLVPALPVVHPDAVHPLLVRLGAVPAEPDSVLGHPALHAEILRRHDDLEHGDTEPDPDEEEPFSSMVLDLVEAGARTDPDVLGRLLITDADGSVWPAGELLTPDAPIAALLVDDADLPTVDGNWLDRYPAAVLTAVGVRDGFRVLTLHAPTDPQDAPDSLPDLDLWWDEVVGEQAPPETLVALADLDLVRDDSWPQALALIAADPAALDAVDDPSTSVSYTRWWLARNAAVDGVPLRHHRTADAADLTGLFDLLPVELPPRLAARLGVCDSLDRAVADDPAEVLHRWADPDRTVPPALVGPLTRSLAGALDARAGTGRGSPELPDRARVLSGGTAAADDVLVLDAPWWAQVLPADRIVPGADDPELVARALDLALATEEDARVGWAGSGPGTSDITAQLAAALAALGPAAAGADIRAVAGLRVEWAGRSRPVTWWGAPDGSTLWVDGSAAAVGRAAAWACGRWADRHLAVAAAAGDDTALAEYAVGSPARDGDGTYQRS
ncbi:hypothetical protein JL107_04070 [Nakamurella flavida]|uniref:ATP-binding protein n=1 Tax=Nakamurella flavida TaxID=363630 RepID=A0A938YLI7_9ACTN|nr:hypothetical protein [Nakamurella flavida]MBM9475617.1 hypothetical protein [Nakamurella flavida]MDP9778107.1 hypothetical protein [Nakamurella flavida]